MYLYDNIWLNYSENYKYFRTEVLRKIITRIENRTVYEILWKKYCRTRQAASDSIIRLMRFALWIPKATNAHSEYAVIIAFRR
jgi:hypothetical protein